MIIIKKNNNNNNIIINTLLRINDLIVILFKGRFLKIKNK